MTTATYDVLVTGGAGFIGSAIINHLIKKGHSVVSLDMVSEISRLEHSSPNLHTVQGDILDQEFIDYWVSKCKRVIHLAAVIGVDHYIQSPLTVLDINISGTRNVLMACLKYQRSVILASSSEVYGKNYELLKEESDCIYGNSTNSRWSSAISKSAAEHYAHSLGKAGLVYTIVRYFNIYGPQMDVTDKGQVIGKFIATIRDNKPFVLVDGGKATRSFCYIDDAAEATSLLAMELSINSSYLGLSINIGKNEPVTIEYLAKLMAGLSGHSAGTIEKSGTAFFGKGFEEIPYRTPNVSRLEKVINFRAGIDLEKGLRKTLDHWGFLKPRVEITHIIKDKQIIPTIRPILNLRPHLISQYKKSLKSGWLNNNGVNVREFEIKLAEYLNIPYTVLVSNEVDAIRLSLHVMGIKGKVILPSYASITTLNAILANNLTPIFCDINPDTFTICPRSLRKVMKNETDISCIIPVNVFGIPPDLVAIDQIAKKYNTSIYYDNSHGFGSKIKDKYISSIPKAQSFSFHTTKALSAIEGGLIISEDENFIKEIKLLRDQGIAPNLLESKLGINTKMDELRAITGLHSLEDFETTLKNRRQYGERLNNYVQKHCFNVFKVQEIPLEVSPNFQNFAIKCFHSFPIKNLIEEFKNEGVEVSPYFDTPLHHLKGYKKTTTFSNANTVFKSLICLPLHNHMPESVLSQIELSLQNVTRNILNKYNTEEFLKNSMFSELIIE